MSDFEETYKDAHASGLLPGVVLLASAREGHFNYSKSIGSCSAKVQSPSRPLNKDTLIRIASCTKLMVAIAVLQCVERGQLTLDSDVTAIVPELGIFGIITGFDESNQPILTPQTSHTTLRHLLNHTSGLGYGFQNHFVAKWVACHGGASGSTLEENCTLPRLFEPGTSWRYGNSTDWAGKIVERVTGETLETYMSKNIWSPLGITDITFWPAQHEHMTDRVADMSTLVDGKAVHTDFDWNAGVTDCMGGGGAFASPSAFMKILEAVLREDPKILTPESYLELRRPQLEGECLRELDRVVAADLDFMGMNLAASAQKNWSFAGLLQQEDSGWAHKGTLAWGGIPSIVWFIDREAGLCGLAACQVLPPMSPEILKLHQEFEYGIYGLFNASKTNGASG